jgi:hypothetical protein
MTQRRIKPLPWLTNLWTGRSRYNRKAGLANRHEMPTHSVKKSA